MEAEEEDEDEEEVGSRGKGIHTEILAPQGRGGRRKRTEKRGYPYTVVRPPFFLSPSPRWTKTPPSFLDSVNSPSPEASLSVCASLLSCLGDPHAGRREHVGGTNWMCGGGGIPAAAVFPLVTVYPPRTKFSHGGMGGKEDKTGFSPSPILLLLATPLHTLRRDLRSMV